jgi:hypothetical protein
VGRLQRRRERAYRNVGITAIRRFAGYRAVTGQLRVLGQLRYEPAVDVLTELWEGCPVEPIRTAAAVQQQEQVNHSVDRDRQADAAGWLASVEYEQVDF